MNKCKSVYDPQEDSTLLEKWVKKYAKGKVLDIGTGSGIQAIAAAQSKKVSSILGTDIQREVIEYCKKCIKNKKIAFLQSDLFKNVRGKFDTIIFNPPYLPQELKLKDLTIEGGKKGYEIIESFLNEAKEFLKPNGSILMVFSSLTKKEKVEEFIKDNLLEFEELERSHIFFEDIYVYLLKKTRFLKKLEDNGLTNVKYFTKGHRGFLFIAKYKGKKVVIKTKNPQSKAIGRIENEAKWLRKLNKYRIGPKLVKVFEDYFIYGCIDGDFIIDYIRKSNKNKIRKLINKILNQLLVLDKLKVDKEEMHHPLKHVIVCDNQPYLIDFERMHYSKNPKNVTQFCQFLMSGYVNELLKSKKINVDSKELIHFAKIYKNNMNLKNFNTLIDIV